MIAIRHRIAALCFLAVFVGYSDRVNMAVASVAMGEARAGPSRAKAWCCRPFSWAI